MQKQGPAVGIIGYGNMGSAIAKSLAEKNHGAIMVFDKKFTGPAASKIKKASSLKQLAEVNKFIVLAVKPQDFAALAAELARENLKGKIFISIMAGLSIKKISSLLKYKNIIRTMPNLPLREGKGVTGWFAAKSFSAAEKYQAKKIISCWGMQFELKNEKLINAITAISGSGPAYFFLVAELLAKSAEKLGLPEGIVEELARQTLIGAAALLENSPLKLSDFRKAITSKAGTTEAALKSFQKNKLERVIGSAVRQAAARAEELSQSS